MMIMSLFLVHLIITSLFNNDLSIYGKKKINIDKVGTKPVVTGLFVWLVIVITGWEISQYFNDWCHKKAQIFILLT